MRETVIRILGAVLLVDLVLIGALSVPALTGGRPIPDILELLASSALAGLLGILANREPAGRRRGRPAPAKLD